MKHTTGKVWLFVWAWALMSIIACGIVATAEPVVVEPSPTPTSTHTPIPLPSPTATGTCTSTPSPSPTASATPSPSPTATHTPSPTPTATALPSLPPPTPTASPTPTSPPQVEAEATQSGFRYFPVGSAQPDPSQPCPGCPRAPGYITGRVVDAGGNSLAGVRLVCYNDWHRYPVVGSKGGGEYDFPVMQAETTWYVVIVDEAGQPISPEAAVPFNPAVACWYRLDWQRVD